MHRPPAALTAALLAAALLAAGVVSTGVDASAASTSSGASARAICAPGERIASSPSQLSDRMGVPQAAASNRRTLGLWPARTMSARVTFRVKRLDA